LEPIELHRSSATSQSPIAEESRTPLDIPVSAARSVAPAHAEEPCPTCAATAAAGKDHSFIYALGQVEYRFPRLSIEKEVTQATGRVDTTGQTDRQAFFEVVSKRANRYLARQLCWVLTIQGVETYILAPREPADLELLIESIEPQPVPWISTVIGRRGPIARPEYCNGLMLPIVIFDQIYTFSREALIRAIPRPEEAEARDFDAAAYEVLDRIMLMADNAGSTDEQRALNYLSVRYPAIYAKAAEGFARGISLTAIETRQSPLSGTRNIIEVVFAFTNRHTDFTEKFFVRVDVSEEFPFLVSKISPYYDR
jgi:PatG Domain